MLRVMVKRETEPRERKSYRGTRTGSFFRSGCKVASAPPQRASRKVTNSSDKATIQNRAIVNQCPHLLAPILLRTKCFSANEPHRATGFKAVRRGADKSRPQESARHKFRPSRFCLYCNGDAPIPWHGDVRGSMAAFLHFPTHSS